MAETKVARRSGIRYLTGVSNPAVRAVAHEYGVGLLLTPDTSYEHQVAAFPAFAVDNGMYGLAKRHMEDKFDAEAFFAWVDRLPRPALFVAAPDVLHFVSFDGGATEVPVGDAPATLAQFPVYARRLRALGFRVALVGQDGMETMLEQIDWSLVDAVFLGGSTEWKLGAGAAKLAAAAKARGLHVHMGRVNSGKRLAYAQAIGCDTADGTFLAFAGRAGADIAVRRLIGWFQQLAAPAQGSFAWVA
jgi:hypothetical protein